MNTLPALLAAACLAVAGCSAVDVTTEMDPSADLSRARSWAWMMEQDLGRQGGRSDRENTYAAVSAAVEDALAGKGWTLEQDPAKADVVLAFQIDAEKAVQTTTFQDYGQAHWTWSRFHGHTTATEIHVRTYDVGTLILDIVDPPDARLLWRGTARAEIAPSDTREAKAALAVEAVRKMFEKFP